MSQEVNSSVPPQPSIKPAPSAFPGWMIGLMFLGVGLFGGLLIGKYVLYTPKPIPPPIVDVSPTPTVSMSPAPVSDPTANWKTYTNTKYGYAIKYPITWRTENLAAGGTGKEAPSEATNLQIVEINPSATVPEENSITIQVFQVLPNYPSEWTKSQIVIGGMNMTKYDRLPDPILDSVVYLINTPDTKNFIEIHFPFKPGNETILKTFDQILSTFKFLDSSEGESVEFLN